MTSSSERSTILTDLARRGFSDLAAADALFHELEELVGLPLVELTRGSARAADADAALGGIVRVARRAAGPVRDVLVHERGRDAVWALLGASDGFSDFYLRHPDEIVHLVDAGSRLPSQGELLSEMLAAVDVVDGFASAGTDAEWVALRVRYRRLIAAIAVYDLLSDDPVQAVKDVAEKLADAAGAALEASLAVARTRVSGGGAGLGLFPREQVAGTQLAIIGMGKAGARELNYVSDVDVIFVGGASERDTGAWGESRVIDIATRLAVQTMRGISGTEIEPPLWEVDPNLRPEGKQGALVRTLSSHLAYYERWAKSWEFQALLKARPLAGDVELGQAYVDAVQPKVWTSSGRENFVESVQRMRERVTDNIPRDQIALQIKLGPGGIRDIEFTVQLLQLVHGLSDASIRQRSTLDAIDALVSEGYIGRPEAAKFERDYRMLRLMEHRLQLRGLRRTHLMPNTPDGLRVLARATGLAPSGAALTQVWEGIKREVREIHVRLFYRPLLSAVAALPEAQRSLSTAQAHDRLAAIGFRDPVGALRHMAALTTGLSRKATIQRHLMPVMIQWFADGADPDYGLLAFRRISERLGETPWFLRMLRDSSAAAESLTTVLSGSRYIGELMEWIPEASAWLDDEEQLRPRRGVLLQQEARAIQARHESVEDAVRAVRAIRRREILRTAMGGLLDVQSIEDVAASLTTITETTIQATLRAIRRERVPDDAGDFDFAVIAMGRFGGAELGFGSDADILYVYRAPDMEPERGHRLALEIVAELRRRSEDFRLPLDLDADLRPEGRSGPLARSIDAYAEYYRRWSMSWEAQALLRARGVAGSVNLIRDFTALANSVRYPTAVDPQGLRDIKRIKARVENERLPQGVDRARHLKLGPGTLSDVEWLVQLMQLEHAGRVPGLRTTSTLRALEAAEADGLISSLAAQRLGEAWHLASRLRSANTLWTGKTSDVLPTDRWQLDGIARILGYPPGSATALEERYFATTRRARRIFEKLFYG
ncbi:bifunctional [glutamine synthetase] adenylyltransferase/[glutamine synthetase]-adenylyl-L-tyrosine phosphorylase [Microbacterium sp. P01]|uniref:bifunctional [glutamine synthetase] adenylyltransferase/[glutamine synthetase]-adenylyl-L-tyrosine phosphorylase n=1 Tax=Microbacterium sp. P01 TaxID=3366261 RepID=UPI00366C1683